MKRMMPLIIMLMIAGCSSTKYKVIPVEGKVTFSDGTLLPKGTRLRLDPAEGNMQTSTGEIDEKGEFKLKHATGKKGAEIGKYVVLLLPPPDAKTFYKKVPKIYYEGGFAVEVKEGMNPIEIKIVK